MDTKTKSIKVKGMYTDEKTFAPTSVIVRFTSDKIGESLSLSLNDILMITVPFEQVQKVIDEARKQKEGE